jgi:hypothetical protein
MTDPSISVACGFLGGTILSVAGGYRVLQHPRPERVFDRIADARWFLAVDWCDRCPQPAAILTHDGQLSFQNQAVMALGETTFLPLDQRSAVFNAGRSLAVGEITTCTIQVGDQPYEVQVMGLEIDPRYGKVVIVQALGRDDSGWSER